jgi:thioredoxin reductase
MKKIIIGGGIVGLNAGIFTRKIFIDQHYAHNGSRSFS